MKIEEKIKYEFKHISEVFCQGGTKGEDACISDISVQMLKRDKGEN